MNSLQIALCQQSIYTVQEDSSGHHLQSVTQIRVKTRVLTCPTGVEGGISLWVILHRVFAATGFTFDIAYEFGTEAWVITFDLG